MSCLEVQGAFGASQQASENFCEELSHHPRYCLPDLWEEVHLLHLLTVLKAIRLL